MFHHYLVAGGFLPENSFVLEVFVSENAVNYTKDRVRLAQKVENRKKNYLGIPNQTDEEISQNTL